MYFSLLGVFLISVKPLTTEITENKTTLKFCKITVFLEIQSQNDRKKLFLESSRRMIAKSYFLKSSRRMIAKSYFLKSSRRMIAKSYFLKSSRRMIAKSYFLKSSRRMIAKSYCLMWKTPMTRYNFVKDAWRPYTWPKMTIDPEAVHGQLIG